MPPSSGIARYGGIAAVLGTGKWSERCGRARRQHPARMLQEAGWLRRLRIGRALPHEADSMPSSATCERLPRRATGTETVTMKFAEHLHEIGACWSAALRQLLPDEPSTQDLR